MGTNYYVKGEEGDVAIHVGKSSAGWRFLFREYSDLKIANMKSWIQFLSGKLLINEYGEEVSFEDFICLVISKQHEKVDISYNFLDEYGCWFSSSEFC